MYPRAFPKSGSGDVQVFTQPSTSADQWHTWNKPSGCSLTYILCIGGGGGGGGGASGTAGTSRTGGGGGGGSALTTVLIQSSLLPNRLYINVGAGGAGGAAGLGSGSNGGISYVSISSAASIANANIVAKSCISTTPAGGAAGNANGQAATSATIGEMPLAGMGFWQVVNGQTGQNGGAAAAASANTTIPTTSVMCQGATGGSGVSAADVVGGQITAITDSLLSEIRPVGAAAGSNDGSGGFLFDKPFFSFAGLGGAASNAGVGGAGGNGAFGSGGGGGGAGTTGGIGGNGGNGIVMIISA